MHGIAKVPGTCQRGGGVLELAPMKRGLSVAGRFLLWFLCAAVVETLVLAAGPLMDGASGTDSFQLAYWAGYAVESLPVALAIALLGAGFLANRTLRHRLSGYVILGSLTIGILAGGVWLSRGLSTPPEPFPAGTLEPAPVSGPARYFVRGGSGDTATGIVYVRHSGTEPRLAWTASGTYIRDRGILVADRTTLPLADPGISSAPTPLPGFRELRTWYLELGRRNLLEALAASVGTAALICGLWPITRFFRWPLLGTLAALTAFVLLGPLHGIFRSPAAGDLAALVGLRVPENLLVGILTGACGLALVFLDFALCVPFSATRRSARRNRGRS